MIALTIIFLVALYGVFCLLLIDIHTKVTIRQLLSVIITLSGASIIYTISIGLNIPIWISYSLIIVIASFFFWYRRKFVSDFLSRFRMPEINTWSPAYAGILAYASYRFIQFSGKWGGWDAWAIWSLHGKFLLEPESFSSLFAQQLEYSHNDYPLMLPGLLAFLWSAVGGVNAFIPYLIAFLIFLGVLVLVFKSVSSSRFGFLGVLGVMLVAGDIHFLQQAASQYSDTLLSLFYLVVVILLEQIDRANKIGIHKTFLIIGLFSGMTIWIKNEGVIFFFITTVVLCLSNIKNLKCFLFYLIGAVPLVLMAIAYKLFVAPSNDLITSQQANWIQKFFEQDRYITILNFFVDEVDAKFSYLPIIFLIIIVLAFYKVVRPSFVIVLLTMAAYLLSYILTPYDLNWHLTFSLERLIHQLYPSLIVVLMVSLARFSYRNTKVNLANS